MHAAGNEKKDLTAAARRIVRQLPHRSTFPAAFLPPAMATSNLTVQTVIVMENLVGEHKHPLYYYVRKLIQLS